MSYHILHQFDEQWFADKGREVETHPSNFFRKLEEREQERQGSQSQPVRHWLIVMASLLVAACALYFALDARRQANDLRQRLSELEITLKK
jgi:hypothetical protein